MSITVAAPIESPSLNEISHAVLTDEGSRKIPCLAIVQPDSSGHTGLSAQVITAGQVSQVTDRRDAPQVTLPSSRGKAEVFAICSMDGSGNLIPFVSALATSAVSFTGSLIGDVTGTQGATVVATVGTSSAANVHAAELLANAATNANTASTIVKRDGSGNFTAGTITAALTGNASTSSKVTGKFESTVITANGSAQNTAHSLGVVPTLVLVSPYDNTSSGSTPFTFVITEGSHDATNVVVTATSGLKYKVIAFA